MCTTTSRRAYEPFAKKKQILFVFNGRRLHKSGKVLWIWVCTFEKSCWTPPSSIAQPLPISCPLHISLDRMPATIFSPWFRIGYKSLENIHSKAILNLRRVVDRRVEGPEIEYATQKHTGTDTHNSTCTLLTRYLVAVFLYAELRVCRLRCTALYRLLRSRIHGLLGYAQNEQSRQYGISGSFRFLFSAFNRRNNDRKFNSNTERCACGLFTLHSTPLLYPHSISTRNCYLIEHRIEIE